MCTLSNINILRGLCSVCYYFYYWREILPCFDFYIVKRSYSSRLSLCTLAAINEFIIHLNLV